MKNKKHLLLIAALVVIAAIVLALCLKKTPKSAQTPPTEIPEPTSELVTAEQPSEPLDEDILLPKAGIFD